MEILKYLLIVQLFFLQSCSKSDPVPPTVSASDASLTRSSGPSTLEFVIKIDKTASSDISFNYATKSGTAVENTDFVPTSGVLTISAGSQSGSIKVTITGDSTRKANQDFSIELSNAKNCTLQVSSIKGTIRNEDGLYYPVDNVGYSTPNHYAGYSLIWSDEFSDRVVNTNNWAFESGNNNGWGNHELEYYTGRTQNAFVSQGNLIIEARAESISGSNYSSARMITKGKKIFKYGRIDIRAKLPQGKGVWPALWMLGNNIDVAGWPACGEIDIMELLGQETNKVYGTLHWGSSPSTHQSYGTNKVLSTGTFADSFHVYSMMWTPSSISLSIDDGTPYFLMDTTNGTFPFNLDFFFIFNIAVGGDWPGSPDGSTILPQRMVVDYVRVFQ
jgi:hypothetical protein